MSENKHLDLTTEEFHALAVRWPRLPEDAQAGYLDQMSRAQRARFERTVENMHQDQKLFASKLTTRQDVVAMIAMWQDRQVLPLAARLDSLERWIEFQQLPFWRRWRVALAVRWALLLGWLESKGVRFVKMEDSGVADASVPESAPGAGGHTESVHPATPAIEVVAR